MFKLLRRLVRQGSLSPGYARRLYEKHLELSGKTPSVGCTLWFARGYKYDRMVFGCKDHEKAEIPEMLWPQPTGGIIPPCYIADISPFSAKAENAFAKTRVVNRKRKNGATCCEICGMEGYSKEYPFCLDHMAEGMGFEEVLKPI